LPVKRIDYLARILKRDYDVAAETPLEPARALSRRLRNTLSSSARTAVGFRSSCAAPYNKMAGLPIKAARG